MTYRLLIDIDGDVRADAVLREDGAFILTDYYGSENLNNDTRGYLAWLAAGNTPEPPSATTPPPPAVSASQAKIALYNAGLLDQVKTLVGAHPYEPVRIWYADANQWERGHVYVQALGAELGLTAGDIDALFQAASLL